MQAWRGDRDGDIALRDGRSVRGIHPRTTGAGAARAYIAGRISAGQITSALSARPRPCARAVASPLRDARTTPRRHRYNHVNVIVKYHEIDTDMYRVVGFYVEPFSIKHEFEIDMPWDPTVLSREKERARVVAVDRTAERARGRERAAAV